MKGKIDIGVLVPAKGKVVDVLILDIASLTNLEVLKFFYFTYQKKY